jgi:hypothetical protein
MIYWTLKDDANQLLEQLQDFHIQSQFQSLLNYLKFKIMEKFIENLSDGD